MANVVPTNTRRLGGKATAALVAAAATYNIGDDTQAMLILNGSGAGITATIATPGLTNSVVTIGAGAEDLILFPQGGGGPHVNHVVTLSATASVTVQFYTSA